ncbi:MAG: amidase [Actinomycetes bacterium]
MTTVPAADVKDIRDVENIAYAGVLGQAALLRAGTITARELVELLLARIERTQTTINAFRVTRPDEARAEADEAQRALASGDDRPLLGVPFAVKDNLRVAGLTTEHGTLHSSQPDDDDSEQVRRMRAAGMICLGKTTMPELALWPFGENRSTGITRNPWDLTRTPGGSSSGSGAAVAAGLVPVATATDGGGSIRIPAACCGLVGLKPGTGVVVGDRPGVTHWHGLSAAGVLTRTVADAAAVMDVIAESDGYAGSLDGPIGRLRIGWSDKAPTRAVLSREVRTAMETTLSALQDFGATVTKRDPDYGVIHAGFVPRYLAGVAEDADTVVPDKRMLEPRTRQLAAVGSKVPPKAVAAAQRSAAKTAKRFMTMFDELDVLVMPTIGRPAARIGGWMHKGLSGTAAGAGSWVPFCMPWNAVGFPAISFPVGLSKDGLPLAVQLVAQPEGERLLLRIAGALERVRGAFPRPTIDG